MGVRFNLKTNQTMRKLLSYLLGEDSVTEQDELVANIAGVAAFWATLTLALIVLHVFG